MAGKRRQSGPPPEDPASATGVTSTGNTSTGAASTGITSTGTGVGATGTTRPPITRITGPGALVGQALVQNAIEDAIKRVDVDDRTRAILQKQLTAALPSAPLAPGTVAPPRTLDGDALAGVLSSAAAIAAGLDPAKTPTPPPPVVWTDGGNQLLITLAKISANVGDGWIEFVVPVSCDQTGDVEVTVAFVTGSVDSPAGGIVATESHPRGPALIVENWHEPLVAFAWNVLVTATSALSGAGSTDEAGRPLITSALTASAAGLSAQPIARHAFFSGLTT